MNRVLLMGAIGLAGTVHAQVGIRAGGNASTLAAKQEDAYRRASATGAGGYQLGVFYEKKLGRGWSVVPEMAYRRQNTDLTVEDNHIADGSYQARYRLALHYLGVPVLVRATVGKFYVEAGPYGSCLLTAYETGEEVLGTIAGTSHRTIDRLAAERYRRFDVGLAAGVGLKLPAGWGVGLRASAGLLSLAREQQNYAYSGRLTNQVVEASLLYRFGQR